jgi:hypothetical protein
MDGWIGDKQANISSQAVQELGQQPNILLFFDFFLLSTLRVVCLYGVRFSSVIIYRFSTHPSIRRAEYV